MLPMLVYGGLAMAGGLGTLHKGVQYGETLRYWRDYKKNTGYAPRYRARAGYYDNFGVIASGLKAGTYGYGYYLTR